MFLKFESAEELKEIINDVLAGYTELTGNYIEAAKEDVVEELIDTLTEHEVVL